MSTNVAIKKPARFQIVAPLPTKGSSAKLKPVAMVDIEEDEVQVTKVIKRGESTKSKLGDGKGKRKKKSLDEKSAEEVPKKKKRVVISDESELDEQRTKSTKKTKRSEVSRDDGPKKRKMLKKNVHANDSDSDSEVASKRPTKSAKKRTTGSSSSSEDGSHLTKKKASESDSDSDSDEKPQKSTSSSSEKDSQHGTKSSVKTPASNRRILNSSKGKKSPSSSTPKPNQPSLTAFFNKKTTGSSTANTVSSLKRKRSVVAYQPNYIESASSDDDKQKSAKKGTSTVKSDEDEDFVAKESSEEEDDEKEEEVNEEEGDSDVSEPSDVVTWVEEIKEKPKRSRKSTTSAATPAKGFKKSITKLESIEESDLPPITTHYDMFKDLVSNPAVTSGLVDFAKFLSSQKRTLRVATMCSGTESPLLALGLISKALKELENVDLKIEHVFSCEIEPFKQAYIERNFSPPILFRDVTELGKKEATTAYGAKVPVPGADGYVDLLVAGTSCVDYSNLNNAKKGIRDGGESGKTFYGMLDWVKNNQPAIVILENVCSAPWYAVVAEFDRIGYVAEPIRLDTKQYYIPHTRTRGYLMATKRSSKTPPLSEKQLKLLYSKSKKGKGDDDGDDNLKSVGIPQPFRAETVPGKWYEIVKSLKRNASSPLEAFLLPDDDPRILKVRQEAILSQQLDGTGRQAVDWGRCEGRHARARMHEQLGDKRPITGWVEGGSGTPMDYIWNDWASVQVERVLDLIDIFFLREAKFGRDLAYKTIVANLSQNVDRTISAGILGICGCLTPTGVPFPTNRGGPLIGVEALALQGIPVDQLLLTKETEAQLSDLAGNAMSSTVVGAAMVAALVAHFDKKYIDKARKRMENNVNGEDAEMETVEEDTEKKVEDMIIGEELLEAKPLDIDHCAPMPVHEVLEKAILSARLCTCEGRNDVTPNRVQRCVKCQASSCIKCGGRPEHHYAPVQEERIHPRAFELLIKDVLPMRLSFQGINHELLNECKRQVGQDIDNAKWESYEENIRTATEMKSEFRFETLLRQSHWIARYVAPHAVLELHLDPTQIEWRLVIVPSKDLPINSPIRALFQAPVARMKVSKDATSLLDGTWDLRIPISKSFKMTFKGEGQRVPSWRAILGLEAFQDEKVFERVIVSYPSEIDSILDRPLSGKYDLLPNCGTATGILHKRQIEANDVDSRPLYFFLDPTRSKPHEKDQIVFSSDVERKDYGVFRSVSATLDPSWRPLQLKPTVNDADPSNSVNCHLTGQYVNTPSIKMVSTIAATISSPIYSIPREETTIVRLDNDACICSQAFLTCEVPISENQASDKWGRGKWYNVDVGKEGKEVFQDWAWITHRLPAMKIFNKWIPISDAQEKKEFCPRCAPAAPKVVWIPDPKAKGATKGNKFIPVEDNRLAGQYEQALKRRPPPFIAQAMIRDGKGHIRVGINISSLVHRAMSSLLRSTKMQDVSFSWKLTTGHIADAEKVFNAKAFRFHLESNKHDEEHDQPKDFKTPLRREQLRSLTWMERQEVSPEPFEEEEISEALLAPLGWRVEGKASRRVVVRGGVLADEVGYGKTAITLGLISVMKARRKAERKKLKLEGAELEDDDILVDGRIALKASLVVCPPHLTKQWTGEVDKFLGRDHKWTIVSIENVAQLNKITISDLREADLIVISATLFKTPLYWDNLSTLAGVRNLPNDQKGGRHFQDQLKHCSQLLKTQIETLVTTEHRPGQAVTNMIKKRLKEEADRAEEEELIAQGRRKKGKAFADAQNKQEEEDESEEEPPKKKTKTNPGSKDRLSADPWGLKSLKEWEGMTCPPLQMFRFSRMVVDEFTYLEGRQYAGIVGLEADSRWVLSGTPPLGDFASVKSIAAFLNLHLGIDDDFEGAKETMKRRKKDKTSAEQFHSFREVHTTAWHTHRNHIGQRFLNKFVRQNLAEIDEIPFEDPDPEWISLPAAERAIYLELDHHIASLELNAAKIMKSKNKDATADRDKRLSQALGESRTPEEALLKRCSHFTIGVTVNEAKNADNAITACDIILKDRTAQREACLAELVTSIIEVVQMHHHISSSYSSEDQRHFEDWVKDIFKNGTGDPEATARLRSILESLGCKADGIKREQIDFDNMAKILLPSTVDRQDEDGSEDGENSSSDGDTKAKKGKKTAKKGKGKGKKRRKDSDDDDENDEEEDEDEGSDDEKKAPVDKKGKVKEIFDLKKWMKKSDMIEKKYDLRERTHLLRKLVKELVGRYRSKRYFEIIREVQKKKQTSFKKKRSSPLPSETSEDDSNAVEENELAILGTCGHHGSYGEVMREARLDRCTHRDSGCRVIARKEQVVKATSLIGDEASGRFGVKLRQMVDLILSIPDDERILVFVQFPDLLQKAKEALDDAKIDVAVLKGSATKMSTVLNAFQQPLLSDKKRKTAADNGDHDKIPRRVLLLNVGDSSASGANLTVANHAIFLNPLLTTSLQDYIAIETQAIGRVRRYGQRNKVHVHRIYTSETIDEQIFKTRMEQWNGLRDEQQRQKEKEKDLKVRDVEMGE